MAAPGRSAAPPKPWERAGAASGSGGPSPFAPPSNTSSTVAAVATSGAASGEQKDENGRNASSTDGITTGRPMPPRPWEQNRTGYGTGSMTSYGQSGNYGGGLGTTSYGSGMYGGGFGTSSYGNSYGSPYNRAGMYGGYGGSMYGSSYGGMGGGIYGNRYGGGYGGMGGGYGMGGMGGGYGMGPGDPNFPGGEPPPQPPGFWLSLLNGLTSVMHFFGRLSMLVDENTQAFHFFITALLQLCDRAGVLYGELARFVLRILGFRASAKDRARSKVSARALEGAAMQPDQKLQPGQNLIIKPSPEPAWDNVWKDESGRPGSSGAS